MSIKTTSIVFITILTSTFVHASIANLAKKNIIKSAFLFINHWFINIPNFFSRNITLSKLATKQVELWSSEKCETKFYYIFITRTNKVCKLNSIYCSEKIEFGAIEIKTHNLNTSLFREHFLKCQFQ